MTFSVGSLVKARGREWVVLPELDEETFLHPAQKSFLDFDDNGVILCLVDPPSLCSFGIILKEYAPLWRVFL